jgi:hypothetical protein
MNATPLPTVWDQLPPARDIADRLGLVLREVRVLRGLLRLAREAEQWQRADRMSQRTSTTREEAPHV